MRRLALLVVLVGRSSLAHAEESAPADAYARCLAVRHAIYAEASTKSEPKQRVRMLRAMPECTPGMTDDGALARTSEQADAIARETEPDWRWSLTWQPFPVLKNTYLFGVSYSVAPNVAVGLHGGIGRTQHVEVGSLYHWYYSDGTDEWRSLKFTEKQIGAHVSYFLQQHRMEGFEVGGDITYQHFGNPDIADKVTNPWISVEGLTTAAFVGWKDITREGATIEIQAGPQMIGMRTDNKLMIDTDWSLDRGVHFYTRVQGGLSF